MTSPPLLPSISVVVPSLDQGAFLAGALDSILRQEYPRLQLIVMDGGSSDDSVDIIRAREHRVSYWQSCPDGGQSAAINAGVARASGDLVAWLNADDEYLDDALWLIGRAWARYPRAGLYFGNGLRDPEGEARAPFCRRHLALRRDALVRGVDYLLQPATFVSKEAWEEVGGLDSALRFCMDWDLFIRIARRYPAVMLNEFLAVSREYEGTKTASGGMERATEIDAVARRHSGEPTTPGSLYYQLETLIGLTEGTLPEAFRFHAWEGMKVLQGVFAANWGNSDGFPETGDARDDTYIPLVEAATAPVRTPGPAEESLPSISIVTPSLNQAPFLERALRSILDQGYPRLQTIVVDGGSTDGTLELLRQMEAQLSSWISEPDRGAAHAINKGFAQADGKVVAWLNSDDMLAQDAIWRAARAFAQNPELDMVYGNALYIDADDNLVLADHGAYRTGLYYGEIQPVDEIPLYWTYVHAVPQPTVFFRRELLQRCGLLDESLRYIFDFDLFARFATEANIAKIERTMGFYRLHSDSKTESGWRHFQAELYAHSRPQWPRWGGRDFYATMRSFVAYYMVDRFGGKSRDLYTWSVAARVALAAATGLGNPERWNWSTRAPSKRSNEPGVEPGAEHADGVEKPR